MSARSFTRSLFVALAACGSKPPEGDPAAVAKLAADIVRNKPPLAGARVCTSAELAGVTMTHVTVAKLAHQTLPDLPPNSEWANPTELDAPAVRVLVDAHADATAARRAAAVVLAAPAYIVYQLDYVDAPMALGMKTFKRGAIGGRVIHYDRNALPTCVQLFGIRNTLERSDWAIAHSDRPLVDPDVAKMLRDDLSAQYVQHAPRPDDTGSAK